MPLNCLSYMCFKCAYICSQIFAERSAPELQGVFRMYIHIYILFRFWALLLQQRMWTLLMLKRLPLPRCQQPALTLFCFTHLFCAKINIIKIVCVTLYCYLLVCVFVCVWWVVLNKQHKPIVIVTAMLLIRHGHTVRSQGTTIHALLSAGRWERKSIQETALFNFRRRTCDISNTIPLRSATPRRPATGQPLRCALYWIKFELHWFGGKALLVRGGCGATKMSHTIIMAVNSEQSPV